MFWVFPSGPAIRSCVTLLSVIWFLHSTLIFIWLFQFGLCHILVVFLSKMQSVFSNYYCITKLRMAVKEDPISFISCILLIWRDIAELSNDNLDFRPVCLSAKINGLCYFSMNIVMHIKQ